MGNIVTANDLKIKGVSAIEKIVREEEEAIITIRGKGAYVIIPIDKYNYYRECELDAAVIETIKDLKEGNIISENVKDHIKRIRK